MRLWKKDLVYKMSKNLLNGCKAYLSGPMEYADGTFWREEAEKALNLIGVTCFNPYQKPFISGVPENKETQKLLKEQRLNGELWKVHETMKGIVADDLAMVDRSDFIVCHIDPKTPTFGTVHEFVVANQLKKPIFTFVSGGVRQTPLWMLGLVPTRYFYDSLSNLLENIMLINRGELEIDSSRWRLLKPEFR